MTQYISIDGQSLADVCMNTYGSMNYFYKLLRDSGITDSNLVPRTGQVFVYDETLVFDAAISRTTKINNIRYATSVGGNTSTYYIVENSNQTLPPYTQPYVAPNSPIPVNGYSVTRATSYVSDSVGGDTIISLPLLANKDIIQVEKNIQPLLESEYSWNKSSGILTLTDQIFADEKLFILYREFVTL